MIFNEGVLNRGYYKIETLRWNMIEGLDFIIYFFEESTE